MESVNDIVFGKMIFDYSWERKDVLRMFDKEMPIKIVASAYTGEGIVDAQREAYKHYMAREDEYRKTIPEALLNYYLDNYEMISEEMDIPEQVDKDHISQELIVKLIRITALYFSRDGKYGYLCDCAWDEEHGISIVLSGDFPIIREQDYLF